MKQINFLYGFRPSLCPHKENSEKVCLRCGRKRIRFKDKDVFLDPNGVKYFSIKASRRKKK